MRATKTSGDVWRGESQARRLGGSVGMFVIRAWTHKSWFPLAVLWGSAASQILIKTGEKGKLPQLEQLPSCIVGCPAQVELCHDSVSVKCPIVFFF